MRYFVIEGIDNSGKTTQHTLLKKRVGGVDLGHQHTHEKIIFINEPGGTEFGNLIRNMLLHSEMKLSEKTIFLLFLAQRAEIFKQIQALPNTVIFDRSMISGMAYACDINIQESWQFNLFATQNMLPEKIVFLEISHDELEKRMYHKKLDSIEKKGIQHLLNIQNRFKDILHSMQFYSLGMQSDSEKKRKSPQILFLDSALPREEISTQIFNFFFGE